MAPLAGRLPVDESACCTPSTGSCLSSWREEFFSPNAGGLARLAAIYLAHPVHTEPVVGLAGRSELLAATVLPARMGFVPARENRLLRAVASFLASDEQGECIAFPAVLVPRFRSFGKVQLPESHRAMEAICRGDRGCRCYI